MTMSEGAPTPSEIFTDTIIGCYGFRRELLVSCLEGLSGLSGGWKLIGCLELHAHNQNLSVDEGKNFPSHLADQPWKLLMTAGWKSSLITN